MINLARDIKPVSYVKAHASDVLKQLGEKNSPVVITQNGEARAVLMGVGHYQNIMDSINLLKILSVGESDMKNGRTSTEEELDGRIGALLRQG
jgi:prevent-host-death family protein